MIVSKEKGPKAQQAYITQFHQDLEVLAPKHPDVAAILNQYFPPVVPTTPDAPPSSK